MRIDIPLILHSEERKFTQFGLNVYMMLTPKFIYRIEPNYSIMRIRLDGIDTSHRHCLFTHAYIKGDLSVFFLSDNSVKESFWLNHIKSLLI